MRKVNKQVQLTDVPYMEDIQMYDHLTAISFALKNLNERLAKLEEQVDTLLDVTSTSANNAHSGGSM